MCTLFGFMGLPGGAEFLIVGFVILLLFGNRLPSVMRSLGSGIVEFKKGVKGIEDDIQDADKIQDAGNEADKIEEK